MKLWLLEAKCDLPYGDDPWDPWYDKAFGHVVRAATEHEARKIADANAGAENRESYLGKPWIDERYSTCIELIADGEPGIIITDMQAA